MIEIKEYNMLSHETIHKRLRARRIRVAKKHVKFVMNALQDEINTYLQDKKPSLNKVLLLCEDITNLDLSIVSRKRTVVDARRFFFKSARFFGYSYASIGEALTPKKNHSTVYNAISVHEKLISSDNAYIKLDNYRSEKLRNQLNKKTIHR